MPQTEKIANYKKWIIVIGIILSTVGGMTQNNSLIAIGGIISIIGTLLIAILK